MKKLLVIGLAVIFVLGMTGSALAVAGITPTDNTSDPNADYGSAAYNNQGGYLYPNAGENPHGTYSTSSNKCKVCRAVHGADSTGEALLRSTKANACTYCHITGGFGIKAPYGTTEANYTTEYENNHASGHQSTSYNGCVSCHSVHGANTFTSATVASGEILRNNPGGDTFGGTGAVASAATTLDEFCRDCHDKTSRADGSGTCGTCHDDPQMLVSDFPSRNQVSHIMTTTQTGSDGSTQVAWNTSEDCRSCHSGAASYAVGNSFPHLTSGADFLMDSHTSTSPLDRVCLSCHKSGTSGVGQTF